MTRHLFRHYKRPSKHYQLFPFRSAIMQSPTFQPMVISQSKLRVTKILDKASELSGIRITRLAQIRKLPFKILRDVNTALVQESAYGTFTFGPVVDYRKSDKSYVPDSPLRRLKSGKMEKNLNILVGYRKNEGRFIIPSSAGTDQGFQAHLANIFPSVSRRDIRFMSDLLYPISDYSDGDQSGMNRSANALQDLFMGCNVHYLLDFMERSYGYVLDTAWSNRENYLEKIFVRGGAVPWGDSNTKRVAMWLQAVFLQFGMFAIEGAQEAKLLPYHENRTVMLGTDDGFMGFVPNSATSRQCRYWTYAPYEVIT
ncbi:Carboxylesterase patB [Erysiphe neolycopersici]|uniref:Carboxylesterase patB n=1 Tax=Erysiphe neolycopersici TaxID=212602 RepID=A0A420HA95_9PEZI|nr:Carboxylesterase patB [Erysiphe neolycopersici]